MIGAAWEIRRYTFPAAIKSDAILEINISSGKLKSDVSTYDSSGGMYPDG
jgi:hypothetical protein